MRGKIPGAGAVIAVVSDPRAAALVPLLAPAFVAYAPTGLVVLLLVAAPFALVQPGMFSPAIPRNLRPVVLAAAALLLWAALSATWSLTPEESLVRALKIAGYGVCGLILLRAALLLGDTARRFAALGFQAGVALLLFQLLLDASLGGALSAAFRGDPPASGAGPYTYLQGGATVLAILAWPAVACCRRKTTLAAILAAGALVLSLALCLYIGAIAAAAALLAGGAVFAAVVVWGRRVALFVAVAGTATIILAPVLVGVLSPGPWMRDLPGSVRFSAYHRSKIWTFTADKIWERPVLGWGLDSARAMPGRDAIADINRDLGYTDEVGIAFTLLPYNSEVRVLPLHPHNGSLQLWLELGGIGALLGAALTMLAPLTLCRARMSRVDTAARLAAFAAAFTVANLSYGIWQSWWQAALWLVAAIVVSLPSGQAREAAPAPASLL